MKKILAVYFFIFFISIGFVFASNEFSPDALYRNANSSYESGDYEKTISIYEGLIKENKISPDVFYNLGNSYFKIKRIGMAILNYERALRLDPRDRDIQLNLRLSKAMTVDKIDAAERGFILNALFFLYDRMSLNEMSLACSFFYLAAIFILILSIFFVARRRVLLYTAAISGTIFFILFIFLFAKIKEENFTKAGIVITEKTDARSGPKEDYLLQFTLHEGAKVRVVKEAQEWYEIELSRDLKGWVSKTSVGII